MQNASGLNLTRMVKTMQKKNHNILPKNINKDINNGNINFLKIKEENIQNKFGRHMFIDFLHIKIFTYQEKYALRRQASNFQSNNYNKIMDRFFSLTCN